MKLKRVLIAHYPQVYRSINDQLCTANSQEATIIFDNAPVIEGYYIVLEREFDEEGRGAFYLEVYTLR